MNRDEQTELDIWQVVGEITIDSTHLLLAPPAKVAERSEDLWDAALTHAEAEESVSLQDLSAVLLRLPAEGTYKVEVRREDGELLLRIRPA